MGYTHYWYRPPVINPAAFSAIRQDIARLLPALADVGVPLAGPDGTGDPILTDDLIAFNGVAACGHPRQALGITWPAEGAGGVRATADPVAGVWVGGALLHTRACGGDCSHESFVFARTQPPLSGVDDPRSDGLVFACCKTAYKAYDLVVTAALIVIQRHCPAVRVLSDGTDADWDDARLLCTTALGYGAAFRLATDADRAAR